jgi:hypothetical protein
MMMLYLHGHQENKIPRILVRTASEFPRVYEQDATRRRSRPVVVLLAATGIAIGELLDAPDVLIAGEPCPVRHSGSRRVLGPQVRRHDGARGVLARDVVRVPAERAEQHGTLRPGHAEAVEEVGAERPEHVGDGGHLQPRHVTVERARRGQRGAKGRGRAAHAQAQRARGVPHAQQSERRRRAEAAFDGEVRAERELVAEQRGEVGGLELCDGGWEQRGIGGCGERRGQAQHAVRAREARTVPVHGVAKEHRPSERHIREAAGEERQRRRVRRGGRYGGVRGAARRAPRLGAPDELSGDTEVPAIGTCT